MAITKVGGYIRVMYVAGDPKGNSTANPYRLDDLLAADVANGWGNITKIGNLFIVDGASIQVGGTTYFTILKENIQWLSTPENYLMLLQTSGLFDMQYSAILYNGNKYIQFGYKCYVSNCWIDRAYRIYSSGSSDYITTIKNCSFVSPQIVYIDNQYTKWEQVDFIDTTYGLTPQYNFENKNVRFLRGNYAAYTLVIKEDITLRNLQLIGTKNGVAFRGKQTSLLGVNVIDCNIPPESYIAIYGFGIDSFADYKSTFNWEFNNQNVHLIVYDKDDNIVLEKDVDYGDSDEITWCYHRIKENDAMNALEINDLSYKQPFKVVISKEGYEDLVIPDINITAGQPTIIRGELVLTPAPPPLKPEITGVSIIQASSQTATDGQITIIAASGTPAYQYSLNGVDWQATGIFSGLAKGTYEVHVKDDNDLTDSIGGIEVPGDASTIYVDRRLSANIGVQELSCDIKTIELTATIS